MADSFADYGNCYNLKPSRMAVTHAGLVRPAGIVHLIRARVASIRFCRQIDSRPFTARTLSAFSADSDILGASNVGRRADLALQILAFAGPRFSGNLVRRRAGSGRQETDRLNRACQPTEQRAQRKE
jgi:hypothetical protein